MNEVDAMEERDFGQWLKERRKALALTQAALADLVGCAAVTVHKIEAGAYRPSRQLAELLLTHLDVGSEQHVHIVQWARGQPASRDRATSDVPPVAPLAAPASPPSATPLPRVRRLPAPATPLIGRAPDLARLHSLLHQPAVRLVTLIGPPGIGKTRLGLQAAADLQPAFADGVCFVTCASADCERALPIAIAAALGLGESVGAPTLPALQAYLCDKRLLLVLDNFEQALPAAPLIADLLADAPGLQVLVTSRAVLHLAGEYEFAVPPLAYPDARASLSVAQLADYPAVRLFVERAQAVKAGFQLTAENAAAVAAICARLDGLPLAIELAATRTKLLPPPVLLARLGHDLQLLTARTADGMARHTSLRGAIAESYALLRPEEQRLFGRLAVFAGGSTLESALAVCTDSAGVSADSPPADLLDALGGLMDQSLIWQIEIAGEPRFLMLETIRDFALEQLAAGGEDEAIRRRHAHFFLHLAEQAEAHLQSRDQMHWLELLDAERDNLYAALHWTEEHEPASGLRLAEALGLFWDIRAHKSEGRARLTAILARAEADDRTPARASALLAAARLVGRQGDITEARLLYQESLGLYRALGDQRGTARALGGLAGLAWEQGQFGVAQELWKESLALCQAVGDLAGSAEALRTLAWVPLDEGDFATARALMEESLRLWRAIGDRTGISRALTGLGKVLFSQGDAAGARALWQESLSLAREMGNQGAVAAVLQALGLAAHAEGDYAGARALIGGGLTIARAQGNRWSTALALSDLGDTAWCAGDAAVAEALYTESLTLFRTIGDRYHSSVVLHHLGLLAYQAGDLARAEALLKESLVHARELDAAEMSALGLVGLAAVAADATPAGVEQAGRLCAAAAALLRGASKRLPAPMRTLGYDALVDSLRAAADSTHWAAGWAAARGLASADVLAAALAG